MENSIVCHTHTHTVSTVMVTVIYLILNRFTCEKNFPHVFKIFTYFLRKKKQQHGGEEERKEIKENGKRFNKKLSFNMFYAKQIFQM